MVFSTFFLQFKPEFCNKELTIWTTVAPGLVFGDFSIFSCKYNQTDFGIGHLMMAMCRVFLLCYWKSVFSMTIIFSRQNSVRLCPTSFCIPRPNLPVTPDISWLPTLGIPIPYDEKDIFFGVSSIRSCSSSWNCSTLALVVWVQTWNTVMLNGLPRKWTWPFCHFWDFTQVLHSKLFCWLWGLLHYSKGFLSTVVGMISIFPLILVHSFLRSAHTCIELHKPLYHNKTVIHERMLILDICKFWYLVYNTLINWLLLFKIVSTV